MADTVTPRVRSEIMSRIRAKNTAPEVTIRHALHRLGFRYRLHKPELPGKPDLTFAKYRAVLFVNGCFWHAHNCHLFRWPQTRIEYWHMKIRRNAERDIESRRCLLAQRWRVLTVWECSLRGRARLPFESVVSATVDWIRSDQQIFEIAGLSLTP